MPTPEEFLAQELARQQTEWGTYVAVAPIFIGGARAFNPGDPVPVSHVTSGIVNAEQVTGASTEQSSAAMEPPAAPSTTPVTEPADA